jgi:hypothetical protein
MLLFLREITVGMKPKSSPIGKDLKCKMAMKDKVEALKDRFIHANTNKELQTIREEMRKLCDDNVIAVTEATLESIRETNARIVREKLQDVLPIISVSYLAKKYFNKTPQWFYQRLNGNTVNGKSAQFTSEDLEVLHHALQDISGKISASATVIF